MSVNPFAGKLAGHYDRWNVGAISLPGPGCRSRSSGLAVPRRAFDSVGGVGAHMRAVSASLLPWRTRQSATVSCTGRSARVRLVAREGMQARSARIVGSRSGFDSLCENRRKERRSLAEGAVACASSGSQPGRPPRPVNGRRAARQLGMLLGVLGDPIRIRIPLRAGGRQELCVGDLVPVLQVDAVTRAVMRWPQRAACARPQAVVARPVAAPRAVAAA